MEQVQNNCGTSKVEPFSEKMILAQEKDHPILRFLCFTTIEQSRGASRTRQVSRCFKTPRHENFFLKNQSNYTSKYMTGTLAKQFADSTVSSEWSENQNPVTEMRGCAKGQCQTTSTKSHFLPAESSKRWVTPHF